MKVFSVVIPIRQESRLRGEDEGGICSSRFPRSATLSAKLALLALAILLFMGAGGDSPRFNALGHRMMCICGCGQVLLECNHVGCQASDKMRNELLASLERGDNDDLILQGFVQNYGPTVIAAPTAKVSIEWRGSCRSSRSPSA